MVVEQQNLVARWLKQHITMGKTRKKSSNQNKVVIDHTMYLM